MKIAAREIGPGHPPYVIAEIGVNHDGEIARALELTEAATKAGADAVKLQYFETDRLLSKAAKLAAYQKAAGETDPVAMLRRLELSLDEMALVVDRAHGLGIHAIVTVFSVELVKPASELAWDAYKSASPDVINKPLLEALAGTGMPLIVSTGASTLDEVVRAVGWLEGIRERLAVLQCVSCYPAPEEAFGGITAIADATGLPTGYSDHTTRKDWSDFAVGLGACLLEKHITDDRTREGPDHRASILTGQLPQYIEAAANGTCVRRVADEIRGTEIASLTSGNAKRWAASWDFPEREQRFRAWMVHHIPVEKVILECERDVREVARQSLTTTRDMASGETISREDLTIKRPGTGIEPFRLNEVIGRTLARDVHADTPLVEEDLNN